MIGLMEWQLVFSISSVFLCFCLCEGKCWLKLMNSFGELLCQLQIDCQLLLMVIRFGVVFWFVRWWCNVCSQRMICGEIFWNLLISRWVNGVSVVFVRVLLVICLLSCWNVVLKVIRFFLCNSVWNFVQNSVMVLMKIFLCSLYFSLLLFRCLMCRFRFLVNLVWVWKVLYSGSVWNLLVSLNGFSGVFGCCCVFFFGFVGGGSFSSLWVLVWNVGFFVQYCWQVCFSRCCWVGCRCLVVRGLFGLVVGLWLFSCLNQCGLLSILWVRLLSVEWKVCMYCCVWVVLNGYCQCVSSCSNCLCNCVQEVLVKEIIVSCCGLMFRWQSMNIICRIRVVDLFELVLVKICVSGWWQRIIVYCFLDGGLIILSVMVCVICLCMVCFWDLLIFSVVVGQIFCGVCCEVVVGLCGVF